ncbi:MAG: MFS transporter [Anaerolineae bacterium]
MFSTSLRRTLVHLLVPEGVSSPVEARNIRLLYVEVAWWGVALGTYLSYLTVFAARLGASNFWIGLLSAGPALVSIFWLLPAGRLVELQPRQMPILTRSMFISRSFVLLMALAPWLSPGHGGELLALLVIVQAIPSGIVNVAFTAMLPDAVSSGHLGAVVSARNAIMAVTSTLGTLVSVPLLAWVPFPANYQTVMAIGFVSAYLSAYYVSQVRVPDRPALKVGGRSRSALRPFLSLRAVRAAWQGQQEYAWFVVAAFVFHLGLYGAIPLFSIYWVRDLHLSDAWISVLTVVWNASSVLASLAAPALIRRQGNQGVLAWSSAALALYPIGTALSRSAYPLLPLALAGGVVGALMGITLFNRLIEVAPPARRASYIGLYNAAINGAVFVAPLVTTTLAGTWGVATLMIASGIVRVLGGLLFLVRGRGSQGRRRR